MKRCIAVCVSIILLSGCARGNELKERAIIKAVAMDWDGQYELTAAIYDSKSENGEIYAVSRASTPAEAILGLGEIMEREPFWGQNRILILGENAEEKIEEITEYFAAENELRPGVNIVQCAGRAGNLITEGKTQSFTELIDDAITISSSGKNYSVPIYTLIDEDGVKGVVPITDKNGHIYALAQYRDGGRLGDITGKRVNGFMWLKDDLYFLNVTDFFGGKMRTCTLMETKCGISYDEKGKYTVRAEFSYKLDTPADDTDTEVLKREIELYVYDMLHEALEFTVTESSNDLLGLEWLAKMNGSDFNASSCEFILRVRGEMRS